MFYFTAVGLTIRLRTIFTEGRLGYAACAVEHDAVGGEGARGGRESGRGEAGGRGWFHGQAKGTTFTEGKLG